MRAKVEEALADFAAGKMLILTDDEDRENEGDLVFAAAHATAELVNFMLKYGRGKVCLTAPEERLRELGLHPLRTSRMASQFGTNFYDPIDAVKGTTTGVSAEERANTMRVFCSPEATAGDFFRPGHVETLGARDGGVLQRTGHTEGTVDLARLAELPPYGVLCEILNDDGTMARMPELEKFAAEFGLKILTIRDLVEYRLRKDKLVHAAVTVPMRNEFGEWRLTYYESYNGEGHLALAMGDLTASSEEGVLVRMHSQCFTGDTLGSFRCDCGPQLHTAMKKIAEEGRGVIVYLHQEGRGIGLKNKLLAYAKQDEGLDTVDANLALGFKADLREYGIGAQILQDLGISRIRLMTNNPKKLVGVEAYEFKIVGRVPLTDGRHEHNSTYLDTKRDRLGHLFTDAVSDLGR